MLGFQAFTSTQMVANMKIDADVISDKDLIAPEDIDKQIYDLYDE